MNQDHQQEPYDVASSARFQIAAIGEVLWDVFSTGPRFGGAPANFACTAANLGKKFADVSMVSGVGKDQLGYKAVEAFTSHHVATKFLQQTEFATGQVFVELDANGRASYEFASNTAWDHLAWHDHLAFHAKSMDAICFGTLGQRSEESQKVIRQFVSSSRPSCLRVFDINLRPPFFNTSTILESLRLANFLKANDEELPLLAEIASCTGSEIDVMRQLAAQFGFQVVALTRGPHGALLMRGNEVSEQPGIRCDLVDTVGAGDAFTAALVLGSLKDLPLNEINRSACEVAAFVCSQPGATPVLPDQFLF